MSGLWSLLITVKCFLSLDQQLTPEFLSTCIYLFFVCLCGKYFLFCDDQGLVKRETRFTSKCPANEIISKIEEAAVPLGFDVKKKNYKVQLLCCDNHIILDIFYMTTLTS